MLPILDRSLLKELAYNLAFTLAVITSVFFTGAAVKFLHKYPQIDLVLLFQVLPFFLLYHLEFVLPLSLLIAVMLVYGRAAANNEITTIKSGGVHPYRVFLPAFLIGALISVASVYLSNQWSPRAETAFKQSLTNRRSVKRLFENSIEKDLRHLEDGGITVNWISEEFPEEGGLILYDARIRMPVPGKSKSEQEEIQTLGADIEVQFDAERDTVGLHLRNVECLQGPWKGRTDLQLTWHMGSGVTWSKRLKYLTGSELWAQYARAKEGLHPLRTPGEILSKIHERLALSTSSLFFVLIGAPLALVFRAGSRLVAFLVSFLVVLFVFYPSHLMAKTLSEQQIVHPVLAAWSGSLLLFVLGLGLLLFVVRR